MKFYKFQNQNSNSQKASNTNHKIAKKKIKTLILNAGFALRIILQKGKKSLEFLNVATLCANPVF